MYPTFIQFGPISISSLWIITIICIYIFIRVISRHLHKKRDDFKFLYDNSTFLLITAIVGARLGYVILHINSFTENFSNLLYIFAIWDQGFSFMGGIIALLIGLYYKSKKSNESFAKWTDYLSYPFLIIMPLVEIGKFLDGSGYGRQTELPIGVTFTNMDVAIVTPVHPVQLYSAVLYIAGIVMMRWMKHNKKEMFEREGLESSIIICIVSVIILIGSLFRGDDTIEIVFVRIDTVLALIASIYAFKLFKKLNTNIT